jgi:hypothetical protein
VNASTAELVNPNALTPQFMKEALTGLSRERLTEKEMLLHLEQRDSSALIIFISCLISALNASVSTMNRSALPFVRLTAAFLILTVLKIKTLFLPKKITSILWEDKFVSRGAFMRPFVFLLLKIT